MNYTKRSCAEFTIKLRKEYKINLAPAWMYDQPIQLLLYWLNKVRLPERIKGGNAVTTRVNRFMWYKLCKIGWLILTGTTRNSRKANNLILQLFKSSRILRIISLNKILGSRWVILKSRKQLEALIKQSLKDARLLKVNSSYRVFIQSKGKWRPLGCPTLAERMTQKCLGMLCELRYELAHIKINQFAYRDRKSLVKAWICLLEELRKGGYSLYEYDFKGYFNGIEHWFLQETIMKYFKNSTIKKYLTKGMKCPVIYPDILPAGIEKPSTKYYGKSAEYPIKGVQQGAIFSPWLANLSLLATGMFNLDWANLVSFSDDGLLIIKKDLSEQEITNRLNEKLNKFGMVIKKEGSGMVGYNLFSNDKRWLFLKFKFLSIYLEEGNYLIAELSSKLNVETRSGNIQKLKSLTDKGYAKVVNPEEDVELYREIFLEKTNSQLKGVTKPLIKEFGVRKLTWNWIKKSTSKGSIRLLSRKKSINKPRSKG